MNNIPLPPLSNSRKSLHLPPCRQITIVGASGAGKSRFMRRLIAQAGPAAFVLSPLGTISLMKDDCSIQQLSVTRSLPDADKAESDLDLLLRLLLADEFAYLLSIKSRRLMGDDKAEFRPTRLDTLVSAWQRIFPHNKITRANSALLFSTNAGSDLIPIRKLSSGEKTVLYYLAAILYAPKQSMVFIDEPTIFLHPSLMQLLWNALEGLRPDCTFIYNTSDAEFLASRTQNLCIWVKKYSAASHSWDYSLIQPGTIPDDIFISLMGQRRPVLFIEGDTTHSLDAKLYPLIFEDSIVRPLGSCNKVIEATRSFRDLQPMHHLQSQGIVDRDRRTPKEIEYLRSRGILVPEVAEIENIFMLEGVITFMARQKNKDPQRVISRVKDNIIKLFETKHYEQALQHTRHKMKRDIECRADARVATIQQLEEHLNTLIKKIDVTTRFNSLLTHFRSLIDNRDYPGILKVFNHKPMLAESGVINLLGFHSRSEYVTAILDTLKSNRPEAARLRQIIKNVFIPQ